MTNIIKAYDIRGIYPSEINEKNAYSIGRAFVSFLQKQTSKTKLTVVVGYDMRLSSPQLKNAIIRGITDQGADVINIELASTPTFYFAVAQYKYDGGIQVTASHNPKEYNGFKLVREQSICIGSENGLKDIEKEIESTVKENEFPTAKKGTIQKRSILTEHSIHDLGYANRIKIKPLKVVADAANAMGAQYMDELFKHLPCTVTKINFTLDGTFPAHAADPLQDETLKELKATVIKEKADIGIATDGDGDRVFFVDNSGKTIPQPIIRGLMAQAFLAQHPHSKICYDIRPGKITEEMIRTAGGIPIKTKVGHTNIKEAMRAHGALFAGESSGHFFLNMPEGCYEIPMIVILKMLELSSQGKPISDIIAPYKKYWSSGEINFTVQDKDKKIQEIAAHFSDGTIDYMDGITIEYPDFWFNVRKSNTEPLLRLNLEGVSEEIVKQKVEEIKRIILEM